MSMLRKLALKALCACTPVKSNRVIFSSLNGSGYSDSPKAVCDVLRKSGENLELLWICKDDAAAASLPEGVQPIPLRGIKKMRALASAKIWVDNCRKYEYIKRKNQFYLQTWHGFALKRIEADVGNHLEPEYVAAAKRDSAQIDVMVTGSGFMEKLYRNSFWYEGPIVRTGTPRNDVFFQDHSVLHVEVCKRLGLPATRKLALYAPTFRSDHSTEAYRIDTELVRRGAAERLKGDWTVVIRLHPNVAAQSAGLFAYNGDTLVDATAYPDMAELLCAADLLITDYSSSMFDYALTGKPVIQFATDLEAYQRERNFYFSLDALPFPLARSNAELEQILTELQPLWASPAWAEFARENDFCEDGEASVRCAALILQQMKKK